MSDEMKRRRPWIQPDQLTDDDGAEPAVKKIRTGDYWVNSGNGKEGKDSCYFHVSTNGENLTVPHLRNVLATIEDKRMKIPFEGRAPMYKIEVSVRVEDSIDGVLRKQKFSDRMLIESILGRPDGGSGIVSFQRIRIGGWVITGKLSRNRKNVYAYLEVNDGSYGDNLYVVVDASVSANLSALIKTGTCVHFDGCLKFSPVYNEIEFIVRKIIHVGTVDDPAKYPIQNMKLSLEYLRDYPHLRARDDTMGYVARYRTELTVASHSFFGKHKFYWVSTPIITPSDCGGEMFQVTTLIKESHAKLPTKEDGKIDYSRDFFGRQAYLSGSGQLHLESYACALGSAYTFGPAFRAEKNSQTSSKHLAEFWMVETVIAFADLVDVMNCAEAYVRCMCKWVRMVVAKPFGRITYTVAIKLLGEAVAKGKMVFEKQVGWGMDLASEHERYLTDVAFGKPVIVYNYPKDIKKAFYMRINDDGKTVAAFDLLVPKVGKIISGSQREERYDVLKKRMEEMEIPIEQYEWYLDLRRYGTVKHGGFGLGFERMLLFAMGMDNIRDASPFPRYRAVPSLVTELQVFDSITSLGK